MKDILGLGIESSCDETSIAVVRNGEEILANTLYSQVAEHAPFRGVVPEIASRLHLIHINHLYQSAMKQAAVELSDLSYAAVTGRPGLLGSLLVGGQFAKCLHLVSGVPVFAVDHVESHFYSVCLEGKKLEYPFIGLLLSGGNSAIFLVHGPGNMETLADTSDDACGEAFDKTASILNLGYPGGPLVEKLAAEAVTGHSTFTKILKDLPEDQMGFSFSGIKTAVLKAAARQVAPEVICRDFQDTAFELVCRMLLRAVKRTGVRLVVAGGGVLANGVLRQHLLEVSSRNEFTLHFPEKKILCTDNGAMTAALGFCLMRSGAPSNSNFEVSSVR